MKKTLTYSECRTFVRHNFICKLFVIDFKKMLLYFFYVILFSFVNMKKTIRRSSMENKKEKKYPKFYTQ